MESCAEQNNSSEWQFKTSKSDLNIFWEKQVPKQIFQQWLFRLIIMTEQGKLSQSYKSKTDSISSQ